jgi:ubiquinone/menaquinone biosynthesis C-methylase UbiE
LAQDGKVKLGSLDGVIDLYTRSLERSKDRVHVFSEEFNLMIQAQVDQLETLVGCRSGARILDLACGAGAVTVEFARRGYRVIGLDCTPAMLELAGKMAEKKRVMVSWVLGDMRTIQYENEMDYVLLRDVVFGAFGSREEHELIMRNIARALKPGGRMLLEVYNRAFGITHEIEGFLYYDQTRDIFLRKTPAEDGMNESVGPPSEEELDRMFSQNGLRVIKRDGWKWPEDPDPPPWRGDLIVAEK